MSTHSAVASGYGEHPNSALESLDYSLHTELNKIAATPGSKVIGIDHNVLYMPQNTGYHDIGPFFASAVITYEVESQSAPAPFPDAQADKGREIPPFPFTTPESLARIRGAVSGRPAFPDQQ